MTDSHLIVNWVDHGREPSVAPNPKYPDGMEIDLRPDASGEGCLVDLPYPAKRCGAFMVVCGRCSYGAVITTAGRSDDPKRVMLPCKPWRKQ